MANFEVVERVGVSTESLANAIKSVVLEANNQKKVAWFEVVEQRGRVTEQGEVEFQVKVKIGSKLGQSEIFLIIRHHINIKNKGEQNGFKNW